LLSSPNPVLAGIQLVASPDCRLLTVNPGVVIVKVNHTARKTPGAWGVI
jgi:hypothetical protein